MLDTQSNQYQTSEKIDINGKRYLKSGDNSRALSDEIKKTGSFINILANSLATGRLNGKAVSNWR